MKDTYPTDLNAFQKILVKANLNEKIPRLRKYDFFDVLNAIAYVVKTGIQWPVLPGSCRIRACITISVHGATLSCIDGSAYGNLS